MGEIERGIARRRASDPGFAAELAAWLDQLLRLHPNRLLPVNLSIARRWGQWPRSIPGGGAEEWMGTDVISQISRYADMEIDPAAKDPNKI
jgi:hypothetical protein